MSVSEPERARKIESGAAQLFALQQSSKTEFGPFNHLYKYVVGCRPAFELGSGIGALLVRTAMRGGEQFDYQIGVHQLTGSVLAVELMNPRGDRNEGELTAANFIDELPDEIVRGQVLELEIPDSQNAALDLVCVDGIYGFTNTPGRPQGDPIRPA